MSDKIQQQIIALCMEVELHRFCYYTLSAPRILDPEYDTLYHELQDLEAKHPEYVTDDSPTKTVGGAVLSEGFTKVTREVPMLSLGDAFDDDDMHKFWKDFPTKVAYAVESKIDGLGVELVYIDGVFTSASTRGTGLVGEDVTDNVRTIKSVPYRIDTDIPRIEIRGEVYMKKSVLAAINAKKVKAGEEPYVNTRNTASGSLKQLDARTTADRNLDFFAYTVGSYEGLPYKTQEQVLTAFLDFGFDVAASYFVIGTDEVKSAITTIQESRDALDYDIDGAVIKVNNLARQHRIGQRSSNPKWAIAFKFPAEQAITDLMSVTWQVGRTGAVTPVGELDPVFVGGTTVSRVTLHNVNEIAAKDLHIGDSVVIQRAGDVIPEIVKVRAEVRGTRITTPVKAPDVCPACSTKLVKEETFLRCTAYNCPAQKLQSFKHFCSREAMNIDGLSSKILEQLLNAQFITEFADLFSLNKSDLLRLDRFGDKKAEKLLRAARISRKNVQPHALVYALGIRNVGRTLARDMMAVFKTVDKFMNASFEELEAIEGSGPITATSISDYVADNHEDIIILLGAVEFAEVVEKEPTELAGVVFSFTGKITMPRREAKQLAEAAGAKVASMSGKTNYLVVGEKPGGAKAKAEKAGTPIITERAYLDMVQ